MNKFMFKESSVKNTKYKNTKYKTQSPEELDEFKSEKTHKN